MRQFPRLLKQSYNLCLVRLISSEDSFQICRKEFYRFSPLLKLKIDQEFKWGDKQQKTFEEIKEYMKCPPVLVPPQQGKSFKLYILSDDQTIRSTLMQEFEGKRTSCFLSKQKTFGSRNKIFSYQYHQPNDLNLKIHRV